jgi:hypothetical protein
MQLLQTFQQVNVVSARPATLLWSGESETGAPFIDQTPGRPRQCSAAAVMAGGSSDHLKRERRPGNR